MGTGSELPGGFGLWLALMMIVICVVCSLPDLVKKVSHSEGLGRWACSRLTQRALAALCSRVPNARLVVSRELELMQKQIAPRLSLSPVVETKPQMPGREPPTSCQE
jgi:hypothetical protein